MLISFSVTNFKSIKNEQTIDMEVDSKFHIDSKNTQFDNNFFEIDDIKLLKSSAIYGANASGKSNFIEAVANFKYRLFWEKNERGDSIGRYYPFATNKDPILFEVEFIANNTKYNYKYSFNHNKVLCEELSFFPKKNSTKTKIIYKIQFSEKENKYKSNFDNFTGDYQKSLEIFENTQNNLFLNLNVNDDGNNFLNPIYDYLKEHFLILIYANFEDSIKYAEKNKCAVLNILKNVDLAIEDFTIKKEKKSLKDTPDIFNADKYKELFGEGREEYKIEFKQKAGFTLDENQISQGTRFIFCLFPHIFPVLSNGGCVFIDELDENLHPDLLLYIVRMFHNPKINKGNGQLIFTAHNDILLEKNEEIFRRDQVWFTSKIDKTGETDLYPLSDFNVKARDNIVKEYRSGYFSARPILGHCDE
jgi:uncharacterized protein